MTEVATPYKAGGWLDGLVYDEERRRHLFNGVLLPSVTQVTRPLDSGLLRVDPELLALAAEKGDAVHRATQYYDEDDLDEDDLDPVIVPYLHGWQKFRKEFRFWPEPGGIERVILSKQLLYTGRADRVGYHDANKSQRIVVDIKSGIVPVSAGPQLAAYAMALNEEWALTAQTGETPRIQAAYVVQLDGNGGYKAHRIQFMEDHWREFTHLLGHYRYLEKHT